MLLTMATTVRQVKRHNKSVKNSNQFVTTAEVEGYGPYKPVPPPKPLTAPVAPAASPPPYRMPPYPLYSEPSIPGSAPTEHTHTNLQTHSNKFPIEREVILSSTDKNSKIPILNEYRKRPKGAIAPDAPHIQLAWTEDRREMDQIHSHPQDSVGAHQLYKAQPMTLLDSSRTSEPSPINGYHSGQGSSTGAVPRTPAAHSTPEGDGGQAKPFPSRTYHTIKDIISSRFNKRNDKVEELSPQSQLRQHGVYLGTPAPAHGPAHNGQPPPSSAEIMRRNQEIQRQIKEMKEAQDDGGFQEVMNRNYGGPAGGPRHSMIEMETPRRPPHPHPEPHQPPATPHHQSRPGGSGSAARPGDTYGRHYPDAGGYGVPGTRRSISEAESARKVEAARREERYYFQQQNQARHPSDPRASKEMESMGVYVSRNPERTSKTPESRTPDFSRKNEHDSRTPDFSRKPERDSRTPDFNRRTESRTPDLERRTDSDNRVRTQSIERLNREVNEECQSEVEHGGERGERGKEEEDDEEGGFKGRAGGGGQSDSGRGSTVYSSGKAKTERNIDTSPEPNTVTGPGDAGWVDMVESELRHILDPKLHLNIANSTLSESISSMTPPLPPLSPGGSSSPSPTPDYKHKSLPYNSKPEYSGKPRPGQNRAVWSARVGAKDKSSHHRLPAKTSAKLSSALLCSSLDLDSMLDEENNSSDEDTTIDTTDTRAIRKQLEGLENMYSEVLKLLGVKKQVGARYQPSDPRVHKRRLYGSLSSLPSSVSSRPIRDKRRHDQERKKVKDLKGINKRFQRLESHVVTLARSVAHLSSEMRTQHLMIQEMEVIRGELAALRTQTNMAAARSHSMPRALNRLSVEQTNSNPERVKKLTKFFGDEPPLLRLFLKKLGYEKYATLFENERIGLVELPYLTEERLHKLGIPLGPRLRIMQEAQSGFPIPENTLCIV